MRRQHTIADVGAQLERTSLAWIRTALALTAVAALIGRSAVHADEPALGYALAAVVAATGVTAGVSAVRSYDRRHAAMHEGAAVVSPVPLLCVAVTLTLTSIATLGIVFT
jgi:putative membrane protein